MFSISTSVGAVIPLWNGNLQSHCSFSCPQLWCIQTGANWQTLCWLCSQCNYHLSTSTKETPQISLSRELCLNSILISSLKNLPASYAERFHVWTVTKELGLGWTPVSSVLNEKWWEVAVVIIEQWDSNLSPPPQTVCMIMYIYCMEHGYITIAAMFWFYLYL